MGNRALIVMHDNDATRFSPVLYLHWHADSVPELIASLKARMGDRLDDVDYAAARLVGLAHEMVDGNTGVGIWSLGAEVSDNPAYWLSLSHGDGGVFLVNAKTFEVRNFK